MLSCVCVSFQCVASKIGLPLQFLYYFGLYLVCKDPNADFTSIAIAFLLLHLLNKQFLCSQLGAVNILYNTKIIFLDHPPALCNTDNISLTHTPMLCNKLKQPPRPEKWPNQKLTSKTVKNTCCSGKYGKWAACRCGISLIPLRLGAVIPINCWKIDAESLAKCVI